MKALRVHIERLVVDASLADPAGGEGLRRAVEAELTRLLADADGEHLSGLSGAHTSLRAEGVVAAKGPAELGRQVARSVRGALSPDVKTGARS